MKKIFLSTLIFAAIFSLTAFLKLSFVRAAVADATGLLWGGSETVQDGVINGNEAGVGWISLNSSNANVGSGAAYAVNVPNADCIGDACSVKGLAWSSNLGAIDFNPQDHCITTGTPDVSRDQYKATSCTVPGGYSIGSGGVFRSGNSLSGWARFVEIAKATADNNTGGLDGWIALGIPSYAVAIDGTTGNMSGYGWAGELGSINFLGQVAVPPVVTITPPTSKFNIATTTFPRTVTLTWSATNATSCKVVSPSWNADPIGTTNGTHDVTVPVTGLNETFTITCAGPGGEGSATALVATECYPKKCGGQTCNDDSAGWQIGVAAASTVCSVQDTCSVDADCDTRSVEQWNEVAPQ